MSKTQQFYATLEALTGETTLDNFVYFGRRDKDGSYEFYDSKCRESMSALKEKGIKLIIPPPTSLCICGQNDLSVNCFIMHVDTHKIIIVGSSCINRLGDKDKLNRCVKCKRTGRMRGHTTCAACTPLCGWIAEMIPPCPKYCTGSTCELCGTSHASCTRHQLCATCLNRVFSLCFLTTEEHCIYGACSICGKDYITCPCHINTQTRCRVCHNQRLMFYSST